MFVFGQRLLGVGLLFFFNILEPGMSEQDVRSLGDTARFFDVSAPTVKTWIVNGCPVVKGGSNGVAYELDLRAVHAWRQARSDAEERATAERLARDHQLKLEFLGDGALIANEGETLSRRAQAEALKAELDRTKLAQLRGELVSAADVKFELTSVLGLIRERLRGLPDELQRELGIDDEVVTEMQAKVDAALSDLADALERVMIDDAQAA
ncbi:MAG: terminase small subunit [Alphaproteobacteria bacterium]|nr:terminase small subunit [Alphaproteobacteria bacterium]